MSENRFSRAVARIDAVNTDDPNQELVDGRPIARELVYGQRMSRCLETLEPSASEALRLAVRGQHIARWSLPRADFPEGRLGYLEWRKRQYEQHAERLSAILREVGYDAQTIERVAFLVRKKALRSDAETQRLEDCACLVFLEHHFAEFAAKHDEDKVVDIVKKTWGKMSELARAAALRLPLGPVELGLVQKALAS